MPPRPALGGAATIMLRKAEWRTPWRCRPRQSRTGCSWNCRGGSRSAYRPSQSGSVTEETDPLRSRRAARPYLLHRGRRRLGVTMMEDGASSEVGMVGSEGLIGVSACSAAAPRRSMSSCSCPALRIIFPPPMPRRCSTGTPASARSCCALSRIAQSQLADRGLQPPAFGRAANRALAADGGGPHALQCAAADPGIPRRDAGGSPAPGLARPPPNCSVRASSATAAGQITIVDRAGLEKTACECYGLRPPARRAAAVAGELFGNKL